MANIETDEEYNLTYQSWHHEATLTIFDPATKCSNLVVTFKYIIPTNLSGLIFQSDSADAILQKATCRFKFSYYTLSPDAPNKLKS